MVVVLISLHRFAEVVICAGVLFPDVYEATDTCSRRYWAPSLLSAGVVLGFPAWLQLSVATLTITAAGVLPLLLPLLALQRISSVCCLIYPQPSTPANPPRSFPIMSSLPWLHESMALWLPGASFCLSAF